MKRLFLQSLFLFAFAIIFGSNAVAWMHGETVLLGQLSNIEQAMELEQEPADESFDSEDFSGSGFDDDENFAGPNPIPTAAFSNPLQACAGLICQNTSIRQSQTNLRNSFHAPARFILFHSFQGYLS